MSKQSKTENWTPVWDKVKGTYCSPACGGRCTREAFSKAEQAAMHTAATLGNGWLPHVWENLGWHWKVYLPLGRKRKYVIDTPRIDMHVSHSEKQGGWIYSAWLECVGRQRIGEECSTLREALTSLRSVLLNEIDESSKALRAIAPHTQVIVTGAMCCLRGGM